MDQAYRERVLRNLYEAIWEYRNSINQSTDDPDKLLGEVIYQATDYSAIVASRIHELHEERMREKV